MARGNEIIVTADPKGQFETGYLDSAGYPGMIYQKNYATALIGGRHTFTVYNRDADGNMPAGSYWVLTNLLQAMIGALATAEIAAGEQAMFYSPRAGEEINLLLENIAGTGDDHAVGEILMVNDGTGKLIATTGTPESECAALKEAVTDPTADQLVWCEWTGH